MPRPQKLETVVRAYCSGLPDSEDVNAVHGPLTALALRLARELDGDVDSKAVPGLARELRATLTDLAPEEADDDDLLSRLERELSTPMGDRPD